MGQNADTTCILVTPETGTDHLIVGTTNGTTRVHGITPEASENLRNGTPGQELALDNTRLELDRFTAIKLVNAILASQNLPTYLDVSTELAKIRSESVDSLEAAFSLPAAARD